jgi:hypothetical protein
LAAVTMRKVAVFSWARISDRQINASTAIPEAVLIEKDFMMFNSPLQLRSSDSCYTYVFGFSVAN